MGILSKLEPQKVFYYFEEICKIPHGSGNIIEISSYLVNFAKVRGLFYIQDDVKNVIIIKEASIGYETQPPIIIQGHMDMVAVKKLDCNIDMETDGLQLVIDGDRIYAEGTSLGGDDGIAVAYALALLDDDTLLHPRLEVVLTVDEETGMDGARLIDLSMLKGSRMLNIDSDEEGIFWTSCAGGMKVTTHLPLTFTEQKGIVYELTVTGLQGGHSGAEIHKERGNSNCLMARILYQLTTNTGLKIVELEGGLADNAIPRETKAVVLISEKEEVLFKSVLEQVTKEIRDELVTKDRECKVLITPMGNRQYSCVDERQTAKCAQYLYSLPNGVQSMSTDIEGLVETSLNLGILTLRKEGLYIEYSIRSSIESAKYALVSKVEAVTALAGGESTVTGDYPGWQFRVNSPLREKMIEVYHKMYGKEPKVEAIHAGLECGLLGSKIKDLDCVSLGPNMRNIHTTEEYLSISSAARVWEFLVNLLASKYED